MDIVNGFQMKMDMDAQLPSELNQAPSPRNPQLATTGDVWLNECDNGHDVRLDGVLLATWP